jgi:hypothetical protein
MDVSPAALLNASTQLQQSQVAQTAQILVLKKAMDIQAAGAMALLQALPANLPLAPSGSVGTRLNVMV